MNHENIDALLLALTRELCKIPLSAENVAQRTRTLLECLKDNNTQSNCEHIGASVARYVFHRSQCADLDGLPSSLAEIIFDIAGQLHDTHTAPEIAKNFESTPEQLLRRLLEYQEANTNE